ncbi:MAG: ComF family protein [Balneolaceae bacterium]|jgi:ComF family protein
MVKNIKRGVSQIVFPNVCVCCGRENTQEERQICSFCLEKRFEDANPANHRVSSDTLLPEGVLVQHALWKFDKGGSLQNLLHQLKYEYLTTIGVDLGRKLGHRVKKHPILNKVLNDKEVVILPVPLHYLKYRFRGFNQAFKVAKGFREVWKHIPICGIKDVARTKNTHTQTGFSLERRRQNIKEAFRVNNEEAVAEKHVVIIDDVFTTGATTFELAQTIQKANSGPVVILTIAQA